MVWPLRLHACMPEAAREQPSIHELRLRLLLPLDHKQVALTHTEQAWPFLHESEARSGWQGATLALALHCALECTRNRPYMPSEVVLLRCIQGFMSPSKPFKYKQYLNKYVLSIKTRGAQD
jgi:hypothetical protein